MKKILWIILLVQNGFMIAQTKTVVTQYGERVTIHPNVNNGLTPNNGTVQLGGALIQPTVLGTTSANTLAITGLQTSTGTDNYNLVVTSAGVLKKAEIQAAPEVGVPVQLVGSAGFNSESDAFLSADLGNSIRQLIFKGQRFDPKNTYNNSTGVFTAPETGYYKFECVMLMYNNTGGSVTGATARIGISKPGQLTFANGNASFSSLNQIDISSSGSSTPIVIPYSGMQMMNKGEQCIFGTRYFGNWNLQVSKMNYDIKTSSYMSITYMGS